MKYFHIDAKIDKELLNRFLEFCNNNAEYDWTIILYTVGGWNVMAKTIVHAINRRKDKCTLICNEAYSAGFYIFYTAKCSKYICENAKGMIHLSSAEMYMHPDVRPVYKEDECIIKNWKENKGEDRKWVKQFMTKKEFKNYKRGDDVYFTFKRMKEIFPQAEIV